MASANEPARRPADGLDEPFELQSVTKAPPPAGVDTTNWHKYVIRQGRNTIVGHLQGSRPTVEKAANDMVVRLNERRRGTVGRAQLSAGRKKKAT